MSHKLRSKNGRYPKICTEELASVRNILREDSIQTNFFPVPFDKFVHSMHVHRYRDENFRMQEEAFYARSRSEKMASALDIAPELPWSGVELPSGSRGRRARSVEPDDLVGEGPSGIE